VVLIGSIFLSGCSAFVSKTETVSAACSVSDALLQINGQQFKHVGQVDVKRNRSVSIMCTRPGYFPAHKSIDYSLSGTGTADIVGTFFFLLPVLGLFSAGAYSLDERNVSLVMIPNK